MHRRLYLAGVAATGGLLSSAFLQVAVAAADVGADGADAFTIGSYTFDPFTSPGVEGWDPVSPLSAAPPLLTLGGGTVLGILPLAQQNLEVFDPTSRADLGSIQGNETVTSLFGLTNAEFTVASGTPADGATAALPTDGSVYDVFNLGHGYENVYTAIPGVDGAKDTVTDTFVTPLGSYNLDSLFGNIDAAALMQPGDAFTGLEVGNISGAADAFSIGGFTLDPQLAAGGEGFDGVTPLATSPPLLEIGGSSIGNPDNPGNDFATQSFDVLSGGSSSTELGTITTGEDVTNLLGFTNTQLVVTGATAAEGGSASDLPTVGSVYDAFNLGHGFENVYTAIPGVDGAKDTVTDTLVTPFGNVNLDSLFGNIDAAAPLNPGDAFTGLADTSVGADAFSIGSTTFDPITTAGTEGYDTVFPIIGAPPILEIGGGTPNLDGFTLPLAPQDFNVYDSTGTEVGSIVGNEDVTELLGLTNTEFTVASVTGTSADLPTVGSVYDVLNLGGLENVYTAIPGVAGAADTVTDTLVTPWGNLDLSSLFGGIDAVSALNPGDAFTGGLEALTSAASAVDPLSFLGL
ncbi:hypothetical protein GCM10009641_15530 [Mycobacterium cookii]|uniref:Uncharacterized protein n=1 Tax=Mycobacterium cookii TaxID=1775 RepID=A0A7I7KZ52_9MYCO|nr:hypothetical protein [Mycobacterium cookii]MCV7330457.1 hypothetical protein [Mycobacterium cookii]BBX47355.1 hypothetical protein MCOO_33700 [Mycobacterium cookii]